MREVEGGCGRVECSGEGVVGGGVEEKERRERKVTAKFGARVK
jgi:hypothetical protein